VLPGERPWNTEPVVSKDKYKGVSIPDVFDRLTSCGGSSSAFRGSISFIRTLVKTSDKNIVLERVLRKSSQL
jgi:hypothetical protein